MTIYHQKFKWNFTDFSLVIAGRLQSDRYNLKYFTRFA